MNRHVNVGIIGAGWMGKVHSEAFRRVPLSFDLNGIEINLCHAADIDQYLVRSLAKRYGFEKWTTDWRHLVQDKEVDIVDICVPNFLHKEIAIEAAQTGKHILCEKPLSTSPGDSLQMIKEVEKAKVKSLVNFNYRKVPSIAYVKSLIDEGELGNLFLFRAFIGQDFGLKNRANKGWRFESSQSSGGSLVTMGVHVIDIAKYLCGDITEVMATGWEIGRNDKSGNEMDDQMILLLKFENGAIGSIVSTWMAHGRKHHLEFEINSEKTSVFFNSECLNELKVAFGSDDERRQGFRTIYIGQPHPYGRDFELKTGMGIGIKESFIIQFYEFIKSITEDRETNPNFYDGWFTDQVIEKAYLSSRSGKWEKITKYTLIGS